MRCSALISPTAAHFPTFPRSCAHALSRHYKFCLIPTSGCSLLLHLHTIHNIQLTDSEDIHIDYGGLLITSSSTSSISSSDKIEPTHLSALLNSTPLTPPSQPLFGDSVNQGLAASPSSSSFASHVTIPPFGFTSFITDHQQTWLPQPPSSAPARTQVHNSFNQDFPLFGTDQETPPCLPQHSRARATSSIAPNQHLTQPQYQLQSNGNGNYSTSNNNRSNFSPITYNQQQRTNQARARPPIPLFTQTSDGAASQPSQTASVHRRIQSTSSIPQGESYRPDSSAEQSLNRFVSADMSSTTFDHMFLPGGDSFDPVDNMMGFGFSDSAFTAINGSTQTQSPVTPRTVSPQELMNPAMAMSAPSSTAFPPLSTPGSAYFESPYLDTSSLDTSPMMDGALDSTLNFNEFTTPLFPQDGSDLFAKSHEMAHTTSFTGTESASMSSASPMVRQKSSPGRPGASGSTHGHARKHSAVAGVKPSKSRKPLDAIVISEVDSREDAKRKKNTAAARKSRQKRQETQDALEAEVQRLRMLVESLGGDPLSDTILGA